MKLKRPSPAMTVALIALVMSTTGSAIAAVDYASNAGAVDGKSAVSAGASVRSAKGKLVAAAAGGRNRGRIPGKFISAVPESASFGRAIDLPDNGESPGTILTGPDRTGGLIELSATCADQNPAPGVEDPVTNIVLTNKSSGVVNSFRNVGADAGRVGALPPGQPLRNAVGAVAGFRYQVEQSGVNVIIDGVVRQQEAGSAAGACLIFGTVQVIR